VSSLENGQEPQRERKAHLIIDVLALIVASAVTVFSVISNVRSNEALILSKKANEIAVEANTIAYEAKKIAEHDSLLSRTPVITIKDQILDEYWDTNPLVFDDSSKAQYENGIRSVGIAHVKARRKDSDGVSQPYYAIVLNSANNERPDPLYGTDNFSTIILASTGAPIDALKIISATVEFSNGETVTLMSHKTYNTINVLGDTNISLLTSLRSDKDLYQFSDRELLLEKWKEKYANTDNGSTINLPVEVGGSLFRKIVFDIKVKTQYGEIFTASLSVVIDRDGQYIYSTTVYPELAQAAGDDIW
jgi:hypothetical protein